MTIRFPESSVGDKFLTLAGKKRAVCMPADVYKKFGPYVIVQAKGESFWRALFRPQNQEPPKGWFYPLE
jgi:hypothetical protein